MILLSGFITGIHCWFLPTLILFLDGFNVLLVAQSCIYGMSGNEV